MPLFFYLFAFLDTYASYAYILTQVHNKSISNINENIKKYHRNETQEGDVKFGWVGKFKGMNESRILNNKGCKHLREEGLARIFKAVRPE